ncbi:MAG: glycoside hydrolase family 57 protein [Candidatus Margulisbacteria bacterium]|nr:glycoside hydrolase family 57 protein [Candidatus Margulisiibacteriota bacterium]
MSNRPINLALMWHMHQPFYKDLATGEFILPWVRLHSTKAYLDMAAILQKFPGIKVNFNLVPSLFLQIEDYINGKGTDRFLLLSQKNSNDLTAGERIFILQNFFMANWENMIKPYPRYLDLLMKRGRFVSQTELAQVAKRFSAKELLDLQVWFNLTWFGFTCRDQDPAIAELIIKGKNFSPEDKALVIAKQFEVMRNLFSAYRSAAERGQVELATSPFYHPILPLLCDTNSALEAMPHLSLPVSPFRHPEDAEEQIRQAVQFHTEHFGKAPAGMWPSEGSVSEAILPLAARAGLKWIAADEAILSRSLHKMEPRCRSISAEELYQPYLAEKDGANIAMLFRNHFLSDQIGFVYYRWRVSDAVDDFIGHLNNIRRSLPDDDREYLVSVILDGENAWEYYADSGKHFLEAFYSRLENDPTVRTVAINEYLQRHPPQKKLTKLFAGSWINNNFRIWIGHQEDNTAWDHLNQARLSLEDVDKAQCPAAWQELYIAEGSDWCWWYGDDHSSDNDAAFDALFRKHLKNIYTLSGKIPPAYLELPIKKTSLLRPIKEPVYLIDPVIDGTVTNYYEWLSAGNFNIEKARGAMHQIETAIKEIYYGFSQSALFVRLDFSFLPTLPEARCLSYTVYIFNPRQCRVVLKFSPEAGKFSGEFEKLGCPEDKKNLTSFAIGKIVELGIPFELMGANPGDRVEFVVAIAKDGQELERWPRGDTIAIFVPGENYTMEMWSV